MDSKILLFCRPGFEGEMAAEIMALAANSGFGGYCKTMDQKGLVLFTTEAAFKPVLSQLIFARQIVFQVQKVEGLPENDRVSPLADEFQKSFSEKTVKDIVLESPDTNDGKALSRFLKKFIHPLAKEFKNRSLLKASDKNSPYLHICFLDYENVFVGITYEGNRSPFPGGIRRLKFPKDGPSRSTLKLEEAIHEFFDQELETSLFNKEGKVGVDLGAAPGGWTYQLVQRGIFTYAVDNGPMDPKLMESGLVEHCGEDAYKFRPRCHIDLLVCDMVDKPSLVIDLMSKWFQEAWCDVAIFNLKLPMKKRYQEVVQCLEALAKSTPLEIKAKHLYHDREEITVFARRA